ncbi:MAG: methylated-DNA--[protein]-cysteine S-methyltransferase [Gammaproteobacteria bacterium]
MAGRTLMSNVLSIQHRNRRFPDPCVYDLSSSPIGELCVVCSDQGVHAIMFSNALYGTAGDGLSSLKRAGGHPMCLKTLSQLGEYFAGMRRSFDIPVILKGTDFQLSAWSVLREIPYGRTLSYEEQAIRLGGKEKVRAVGRANGTNPVPILIPCHRVIGKNGSLTGFGGGLEVKKFLLDLESNCQPKEIHSLDNLATFCRE